MMTPRSHRIFLRARTLAGLGIGLLAVGIAAGPFGPGEPGTARAESRITLDSIEGDGPLSDREVRRRFGAPGSGELRDALGRIGRELLTEGFLEAALSLTWSDPERPGAAQLGIEAGPRARWDTLRVQVRGDAERPIPYEPSGDFSVGRFDEQLQRWVERWAEIGHPFVVAEVESLTVREGRVRVGIRIDPGPKVSVAELAFPGRRATRATFLEGWLRFEAGESFRESALGRRQRKLERTGLFTWVGDPRIELIGAEQVRVHFPLEERPHNRIEGAVGYAGRTGTVSGRIDLEMGNLFGTGRALAVRWERLREDDSRLDLRYAEPTLFGWPVGMKIQVYQQVEDTTFTLDRFEAGLFSDLATDLTVSLGFEVRRSVLGTAPSDLIRRRSTVFGLEWETVRPGRLRGQRVEGTFRTGRSRYEFANGTSRSERMDRVEATFESYWRRGTLWVARTVLRGGGLSGARDRPLPASEALWIGGASGPRGWDEESFATRRYLVGQLEVGVALAGERGRIYGFTDGSFYRSLATGGEEDAGGWGVGVASETSRRALVLDYGIPFGEGFREGRIHLRVRTRF